MQGKIELERLIDKKAKRRRGIDRRQSPARIKITDL